MELRTWVWTFAQVLGLVAVGVVAGIGIAIVVGVVLMAADRIVRALAVLTVTVEELHDDLLKVERGSVPG